MQKYVSIELLVVAIINWIVIAIRYWDLSEVNGVISFLFSTMIIGFGIATLLITFARLVTILIMLISEKVKDLLKRK